MSELHELQLNIEEIIASSKNAITEQLIQQTKENLIDSLSWQIKKAVDSIAAEIIKNEISPLVKEKLHMHKTEIVEEIYRGVLLSVKNLGEKLVERAIKNLSSSWKLDEVSKILFS